jgi:RNA polymerase sigma-70 factor (ECF subfamily)
LNKSFSHNTQRLVSLAKNGDESALQQLCDAYAERVRRIVRLRMGDELRSKLQSMDLVQDVFVSVLRGLKDFTYEDEGDFVRWLATITENRIRDSLEKLHAGKRDIRREVPLDVSGQSSKDTFARTIGPVASTTPSMLVSRREDLDRLEAAIEKIPSEYREVILLAKIEGLSGPELAQKLGKTPGAARALLSRALAALAGAFGET